MACCSPWRPVAHGLLGRPPPYPWTWGLCLTLGSLAALATRVLILAILHIKTKELLRWGVFIYHFVAGGQSQEQIEELGNEHVGTPSCQTLTVLLGETGEITEYQRMGTSYRASTHTEGLLRWTSRGWVVMGSQEDLIRMDTPHNMYGNVTYHYFCQPLPPLWFVPIALWSILVLLPILIIPLFILLWTFRCRERQFFCHFYLWSILSPLTAGPLNCTLKAPSHLSLAKNTSILNLVVLTFSSAVTLVLTSPFDPVSTCLLCSLLLSLLFSSLSLHLVSPSPCPCCCKDNNTAKKLLVLDVKEPDKPCYQFTAKL